MRPLFSIAILVALASTTLPQVSAAVECPVGQPDETIKLLTNAKTCKQANDLLGQCSWNTSMDVQFADVVQNKCEKDFLAALPHVRRAAYATKIKRCDTKYANKSGTMYVSFSATCKAGVAAKYSARAAL